MPFRPMTGIKSRLEVDLVVIRVLLSHTVLIFDSAGSQPENVFLDGVLAENMLGELWPAHFTCQLLSSDLSFWSPLKHAPPPIISTWSCRSGSICISVSEWDC